MAYRCSHCGSQAPSGAKICFMCGGRVVDEGAAPLATAKTEIGEPLQLTARSPQVGPTAPGLDDAGGGAGSAGWGQAAPPTPAQPASAPYAIAQGSLGASPAMGAPGQLPGAPGMPGAPGAPGYGGPPMGVPLGPGGYPPAARKSDDTALKIGCGIAGCAGVGLVLVVVFLVLFYLLQSSPRPTASGPSSGGPSSTGPSSGGPSAGDPLPRNAAPRSGSLRSIVKEQVGPYRLVASRPTVPDDPFRQGAVDSLGLSYESPAGIEVKHFLVVYESKAQAESKPQAMIELIRKEVPVGQTFTVRSQPYKNRQGKVIGKVYHVETDPEVVMWHNGKLFAVTTAPSDHARQFFKAVPY